MKKFIALVLVLVLALATCACAEVSVCHHGDGKNCVAERNTVGKVAAEAPANLYDNVEAVKAAGFEALISTTGLFNAVYNGSASIVERYELVIGDNAVVPAKGNKLAIEDGAAEVKTVAAPADFGTVFAVVRSSDGRFYGAVVICCCGGGNGTTTKTAHSKIEDAVKEETDWDEEVVDLRTKTSHSEIDTSVSQVSSSEFAWDDEVVDLRGGTGKSSTAHGNVPVE